MMNELGSREQALLILRCFEEKVGRPLLEVEGLSDEEAADRLFQAPFVVASHDLSEDPRLNYANAAALNLWETDAETLLGMPSRYTAEPMAREEREAMLAQAREKGYIDDYRGIRISTTGRRFEIRNAIVWGLTDEAGQPAGQAATFSEWSWVEDAPES